MKNKNYNTPKKAEIKQNIKNKGSKFSTVAKKIGLSRQMLDYYLSGEGQIDPFVLDKLLEHFPMLHSYQGTTDGIVAEATHGYNNQASEGSAVADRRAIQIYKAGNSEQLQKLIATQEELINYLKNDNNNLKEEIKKLRDELKQRG